VSVAEGKSFDSVCLVSAGRLNVVEEAVLMRTLCSITTLLALGIGSALALVMVKGDLNGDGKVNKADAQIITRLMIKPDSATPAQKKAADLNGDGVIDMRDVRIILQKK
jgi:hypothetical protein